MTSLVTPLSRFPIFLTRFPISLPSSCSIYKSTVHITFSLDTSNKLTLKKLSFDVPHYVVMMSQNRFLNICHDFHKIFCLLTSFVSAWCIWLLVTSYQMNWHSISFRLMWPSCGYDVTKSFSNIYNMIFLWLIH